MHYKKPDRLPTSENQKITAEDSKTFPDDNQNEFSYSPKVSEYIKDIIKNRKEEIKLSEVAEITGIPRAYLHQIIPLKDTPPKSAKNNPDRKMLLAVALALRFSLEETQNLLKFAKVPELYPQSRFDAVIIFALEKKYNLVKTNILLDEKNCDLLIFDN